MFLRTVLPIVCISCGLIATAVWVAYLSFELFRAVELLL
jgi:DNA-directed RNA polymerase subunit N (RpoN/RPB10)